jgi:hypothetical protein
LIVKKEAKEKHQPITKKHSTITLYFWYSYPNVSLSPFPLVWRPVDQYNYQECNQILNQDAHHWFSQREKEAIGMAKLGVLIPYTSENTKKSPSQRAPPPPPRTHPPNRRNQKQRRTKNEQAPKTWPRKESKSLHTGKGSQQI